MKSQDKIFHVFLMILLLVSANSCKKDKSEEPDVQPGTGTLSIVDFNVKGYQAISLAVANFTLDNSEYELQIGSKKVKGLKNDDNSLSIMVPGDLANGKYILKSAFATNQLELTVTAPAPVADPAKMVMEFVGNTTNEVSTITAMLGVSTPPAYLTAAKEKIDAAMTKFNQLSPADKQIAAQILEANYQVLVDGEKLLGDYNTSLADQTLTSGGTTQRVFGTCEPKCVFAQLVKLLIGAALVAKAPVIAGVIAADIIISVITGKNAFLLAKMLSAINAGLEFASFPQIKFLEVIIDKADNNINSGISTQTITGVKILKSEPFNFKLAPIYRTIRRTDAQNKNIPFAASVIEAYDNAKAAYDKYAGVGMGPFPGFSSKEDKQPANSLADWEMEITANNAVTVSNPVGTPGNFNVTFNSTLPTEQSFEFDINFKGRYETISEHVIATLIPNRDPNKIEMSGGNSQIGEFGKKLSEPLQVIVKDVNGKTLENVKVQWNIKSGGGTLNAAESLTDGKGIAKIEWTLGSSNTLQEVEAIVKRKDGTNVINSPLAFKATVFNLIKLWNVQTMVRGYDLNNKLNYNGDLDVNKIEFTSGNQIKIFYNPHSQTEPAVVDIGSYTLDRSLNTIVITGTGKIPHTNLFDIKWNIMNVTSNGFTLKTDRYKDGDVGFEEREILFQ